jgi:putative glutamine amidotransferase
MELDWIGRFRKAGKPVFGICRGLQVLHVTFGGSLIQHLPDASALAHELHGTGDDDVMHGIRWTAGTRLAKACGMASVVNSHHHQAADPVRPVAELRVAALSPAGVIEAIESVDGAPVSAVQWHPERLGPLDPARDALLRHWISLASEGIA